MWAEAAKEPAGGPHNGSLCYLLGLSPCSAVKSLMLGMHSRKSAMGATAQARARSHRSNDLSELTRPSIHQQELVHTHEKPGLPRRLRGGSSMVVVVGAAQGAASAQPSLPQLETSLGLMFLHFAVAPEPRGHS